MQDVRPAHSVTFWGALEPAQRVQAHRKATGCCCCLGRVRSPGQMHRCGATHRVRTSCVQHTRHTVQSSTLHCADAHRTGPPAAAAAALAGFAALGSGAAAARASAAQDQATAQRVVRPWHSSVVRTAGQRSADSAPRTVRSVAFLPTMLVYQCTRPCMRARYDETRGEALMPAMLVYQCTRPCLRACYHNVSRSAALLPAMLVFLCMRPCMSRGCQYFFWKSMQFCHRAHHW